MHKVYHTFRIIIIITDIPFQNFTKQCKTRSNLLEGVRRLDRSTNDGDIHTLRSDLMRGTDHAHVYVVAAPDLRGRDDDLRGLRVVGVGNRVVQEADGAHDATHLAGLAGREVAGVADDESRLSDLQ